MNILYEYTYITRIILYAIYRYVCIYKSMFVCVCMYMYVNRVVSSTFRKYFRYQ